MPIVEPEGHFVEVSREMLRRDFMPRSNDAALEQAKRGLDAVRGNVSVNVDLRAMVDRLVSCWADSRFPHSARIGSPVIRHNHVHVTADVLADVLRQRPRLRILSMEEPEFPAALLDADNWNLFALTVRDAPCAVRIPLTTADPSFVHFNCAIQRLRVDFFHCGPDAMAQIPRGFVASADHALDLVRRDAFAGLAHEVGGSEPSRQGELSILEDGSGQNGELIAA